LKPSTSYLTRYPMRRKTTLRKNERREKRRKNCQDREHDKQKHDAGNACNNVQNERKSRSSIIKQEEKWFKVLKQEKIII
jgi:hypothetical protein